MKWRGWAGEPTDELDCVQVLKNCPAKWKHMHGDDQVRHCTHCDRKVYNLSNMTREEALRVVQETEGRLCARFYRRPDGMIMTRDCGKTMRATTKAGAWLAGALAVMGFASLFAPVYAGGVRMSPRSAVRLKVLTIQRLNQDLEAEKDLVARKELQELRDQALDDLKQLVDRVEMEWAPPRD